MTHFSANVRIASRCFGLRCVARGSTLSGSSVTSGMSSGGRKNASTTGSTAASAASASAVAAPQTATSGVWPAASQSASAFLSAADGSTFARSAWRASTSASFRSSSADFVNSSSRLTSFAFRNSMAASTSGVRMRLSPSVSISSSIRRSKRTPVVGIEIASQCLRSRCARLAMSAPLSSLTCCRRPVCDHFQMCVSIAVVPCLWC